MKKMKSEEGGKRGKGYKGSKGLTRKHVSKTLYSLYSTTKSDDHKSSPPYPTDKYNSRKAKTKAPDQIPKYNYPVL